MKPVRNINKLLVSNKPILPKRIIRAPRGPTVRWDINYEKLFAKRRK